MSSALIGRKRVVFRKVFEGSSQQAFAKKYHMTFIFSGLGLCGITEFGRILCYNVLVDGEREVQTDESEDETEIAAEDIIFSGYKQMMLIINSQEVETGKSFMAEMLLRIYHGRKVGANGTLSFDSCKEFLRKGEPIVVGKLGMRNLITLSYFLPWF